MEKKIRRSDCYSVIYDLGIKTTPIGWIQQPWHLIIFSYLNLFSELFLYNMLFIAQGMLFEFTFFTGWL